MSSLSNRYIGAFTNRKEFASILIKAGQSSGERVWPFPLDEDFEEDLKSDIADILQVTQSYHACESHFLRIGLELELCCPYSRIYSYISLMSHLTQWYYNTYFDTVSIYLRLVPNQYGGRPYLCHVFSETIRESNCTMGSSRPWIRT